MMHATDADTSTLDAPVVRPSTAQALWQSGRPLAEPTAETVRRPLTVLLVDDSHHHRIPLVRALRGQKYDVLYAASGPRGEDLSRTWRHEIDALVVCADMKRMGGFELARRLRRERPEIGVLMMCRRSASPQDARIVLERGFPVIEEPFTPEDLCRRLTGVLAARPDKVCASQR
jgi:DNA-binding response OmpR family regulator